ncbi:ATP synthase subunit I [Anaerosphaera multitolerans]|uniref:ATP synthase subunit I n=1 Tax=Anaerosphaera multitolerans TaxID=2487351 RepID=A0A437S5Q1_9FIRM|nr:ATP synthase subunit I [Anaerosphaera multitolerans]RVU54372.1 hypothetical protein EF514_07965 [Anaerosphaera multitolerans]
MNWFKKLSRTAQLMIYSLIALIFIFLALAFIVNKFYLFEPMDKFSLGLVTGTLLSIYKVVSMEKSINKIVSMEEKQANLKNQLYFLLRYFITFIYVAIVIIFRDYIGVFGAIIGMLSLQVSAYMANYLLTREEKKYKGGEKN